MTPQTHYSNRHGFTVVELLTTISVLVLLIGIGLISAVEIKRNAERTKLQSQTNALNSAIDVYQLNGGYLSALESADGVIEKLKTFTKVEDAESLVGIRGAMVDSRLRAVHQTDAEAASNSLRAVWNPSKRTFELANGPAKGIKSFSITDETPSALADETRQTSLEYAKLTNWVWDYVDTTAASKAGPSSIATTPTATPPVVGSSGPGAGILNEPVFSVETGTWPVDEFSLTLTLSNPNPPADSRVFYSVNSGPWAQYSAPLTIDPSMSVQAISVSSDPDRFADSTVAQHTYTASPVQLADPLLTTSSNVIDYQPDDSVLVTLENPNDPQVSRVIYRLNGGAWSNYTGAFSLQGDSFPEGIEIESQVVATAPYYLDSGLVDGDVSVDFRPIPLEKPVIDFNHRRFEEGVTQIQVTLLNPNPFGSSEVLYKIIPASAGIETNYMLYTGEFPVNYADYEDGFAIKTFASTVSSNYINSGYAKKSTGSYFGDDVNVGGLSGKFYDLKRFADGTETNIHDHTENWRNEVFYDYLRQMTPYEGNGDYSFDASVLDSFYSPDKELFASQFATPFLEAETGPSAFGLGDQVDPTNWLAHYSGKVQPEVPGYYRFSGRGDDVLQVWIDGELVHNGTWYATDVTTQGFGWTEGDKNSNGRHNLSGEWFYLDAGAHTIDVVIGEQPGGEYFNALGIELQDSGVGPQIFTTRPLDDDSRAAVENAYAPIRPGWDSPYNFFLVDEEEGQGLTGDSVNYSYEF